jgi:hypothetical protein
MPAMRGPWLALIVVVYVSLDVSNPLMPGALTFGVDSVEARQADRFRGHDDGTPLPLAPGAERLAPVERSVTLSRTPAPAMPCCRQAHVTRSHPSLRAPAPSPEDH